MKIVHFISKFGGGGLERRAIQTVKGLCAHQDVEQTIVVYSRTVEYEEALHLGVPIHYIESHGKKAVFKEIKSILAAKRPDIVHSWLDLFPTEHLFFSLLKPRFGYKYIHGAVCDGNVLPKWTTIWLGQKISFLFADAIVSNSSAGLKAKNAPKKKSVIIYNGFDFARIPQHLKTSKKDELGVNTQYMVTMCGRVDGSKDWDSFLYVAQRAKENNIDVSFVAIGNGVLLDTYRKKTKDLNLTNVLFTGRRTDVEELIGLSDVCMLLSDNATHAEGVSNFIMESMASGKPVIATRNGGTPEIVTDGVNGYVVDDNREVAYQKLVELIGNDDKRKLFGSAAREEINNRFSLALMTKNYLALYNRLLNK